MNLFMLLICHAFPVYVKHICSVVLYYKQANTLVLSEICRYNPIP